MESKVSSQSATLALAIARLDSSANPFIQTDLKAFSAKVASSPVVITCVTAQNSDGVASSYVAIPFQSSHTYD